MQGAGAISEMILVCKPFFRILLRSRPSRALQDSAAVTGAAEHSAYGFEVDWMSKSAGSRRRHSGLSVFAALEERVTLLTILAYYPAVRADVLAVVTAEASGVVQVPDIVGMGMPATFICGNKLLPKICWVSVIAASICPFFCA